ncbi:MAG: MFS transporter, partial [Bacteroidales bacterium]|nr:MFS transporter [Bacteroidales bacterium]
MESTQAVNRAKQWQVALFPFNNAATNVYFAFYTYFTYYAIMYLSGSTAAALGGTVASAAVVLAISTFNSLFAPLMRVFDGITDPICGSLMDRTQSRFGKFRPFMVVGNCLLALSLLLMMVFFRGLPDGMGTLRWVVYIVSYIVYVIGYTAQCACTKAGQTCLTNDPKQRSQFVIWNM